MVPGACRCACSSCCLSAQLPLATLLTRAVDASIACANEVERAQESAYSPDVIVPPMKLCWPFATRATNLKLSIPVNRRSKDDHRAVDPVELLWFQLLASELEGIKCCDRGVGQLVYEVGMLLWVQLLIKLASPPIDRWQTADDLFAETNDEITQRSVFLSCHAFNSYEISSRCCSAKDDHPAA